MWRRHSCGRPQNCRSAHPSHGYSALSQNSATCPRIPARSLVTAVTCGNFPVRFCLVPGISGAIPVTERGEGDVFRSVGTLALAPVIIRSP